MKAFITACLSEDGLATLGAMMEVVYEPWTETGRLWRDEEFGDHLAALGATIVICETDLVHEEVFERAPLELIAVCRSDPLTVDLDEATARGVPVLFTPGRNAIAVAEHTLCLLLAVARRLRPITTLLHSGRFDPTNLKDITDTYAANRGIELAGKTAGLIGLGHVGREVAGRLAAMGMSLIGYDPPAPDQHFSAFGVQRAGSLHELLAASDVVTLHAAVTSATRRMMNAEAFAAMRPGAILINTARAALVDEAALYEALSAGQLGGAGLDVFRSEPVAPDDPLLSLDCVVGTPHLAGNTVDVIRHQTRMVVEGIQRWRAGERPAHVANPEVWS